MLFSQDLLDSLPIDPLKGAITVCDRVLEFTADSREWDHADYHAFMEGYALLTSMEAAKLIDLPETNTDFEDVTSLERGCNELNAYFLQVKSECAAKLTRSKYAQQKAHFSAMLGAVFVYEFTQGDLDRVQELLNELRVQIQECPKFAEEHRRRLLLKLEKLQSEVHKKMSSLDNFWGIVLEGGVVLKKLGEDAKPIVDRIRELAGLAWRTQARAEDLPTDATLPMGAVASEALPDSQSD